MYSPLIILFAQFLVSPQFLSVTSQLPGTLLLASHIFYLCSRSTVDSSRGEETSSSESRIESPLWYAEQEHPLVAATARHDVGFRSGQSTNGITDQYNDGQTVGT